MASIPCWKPWHDYDFHTGQESGRGHLEGLPVIAEAAGLADLEGVPVIADGAGEVGAGVSASRSDTAAVQVLPR